MQFYILFANHFCQKMPLISPLTVTKIFSQHKMFLGVLHKMNNTFALTICLLLPCLMSTLGSCLIFFFDTSSSKITLITNGLAAGIMFSASIWSLLLPAMDFALPTWNNLKFIPIGVGFAVGVIFLILLDFFCSKLIKNSKNMSKPIKFFSAMTVHNIPEGLAVGFSIGTAISSQADIIAAVMFAVGIAIQNFPEGFATALPLNKFLSNKQKSFFLSFLSGFVEPIFCLLGYFLAIKITPLLPWVLSFAAGAMIFVVIDDLLPELCENKIKNLGSIMFCLGFLIMFLLDICL